MLNDWLQSLYEFGRPPLPPDDENLLADIELFELHAQVYHLLQTYGLTGQFSPSILERLKAKHHRTYLQNLFIKRKEEEVLRMFERCGIRTIPLKGTRFAENYFGHFAARITSDIDLLVPEDQLQPAIGALVSAGYAYEITKDHHARLHRNGLMIELHWTLDIPEWNHLNLDRFWEAAESLPAYRNAKELSPADTLYFICLHGARHQMDSLRYLLDVVQVLETSAEDIDLAFLMKRAKEDRTSKRLQAVLSIVYRQFPHLNALKPLPFPMMETPWRYEIVRKALLGKKSRDYYAYKLFFRHFMFDTWTHRWKSIRKSY